MTSIDNAYARILVDNHITEDDPSFMSRFDPGEYVRMMKKARVDAAMVSACCHNGNCYYPTKAGHMHKNLQGRDIFGEVVTLLRNEGISPVAYSTVLLYRHAAIHHPEWRAFLADGSQSYRRSWYICPNNPEYVRFAKEILLEIAAYDVDSLFIDITFWSGVCICAICRKKYQDQFGRQIPTIIDWNDKNWVHFQRTREQWLSDFAHDLTRTVKAKKPDLAVVHQLAPILLGYNYGQSVEMSQANDYASGDFYGGRDQQRLGTKVMAAISKTIPYEWMTSRCVTLYDHTSTKSEAELATSAATTLANGGAYFFIDAINPDGTLNVDVYDRLGQVASRLAPFKKKVAALRPVICADAALYFSMPSHISEDYSGKSLREVIDPANNMDPSSDLPAIKELLGTSIILNRAKIPYRVITNDTTNLEGLKTIIVNHAAVMSEAEVDRIRNFVADGGTLIATGMTSYYNTAGETTGDFALNDLFGVSFTGKKTKRTNYLETEQGQFVSCERPAPIVKTTGADVLAQIAEPVFGPDDFEQFASYHSNPPGPISRHPGFTLNDFGKGRCIYLCSSQLILQQDAQQSFAQALFKKYAPSSLVIDTNAPPCVEITLLRSTQQDALLVCFVNDPQEFPGVPVHNLNATIRLPDGIVANSCRTVSDEKRLDCLQEDGRIAFTLPYLRTIEMVEIQ
jgi:hypothetical protein